MYSIRSIREVIKADIPVTVEREKDGNGAVMEILSCIVYLP